MTRFVGTPLTGIQFATVADEAVSTRIVNDSQPRIRIDAGGRITWSDGSVAGDTNLYRNAANYLVTDDVFKATGGLVTLTTNGAPTQALDNGAIAIDTTNHVFYFRSNNAWNLVTGGGGASVTIAATEPVGASGGDLWYNSTNGSLYVFTAGNWVKIVDNDKAPLASPTFTGTVTLPDNTVALGTKTTGDYVASLVAGTGVTLTNNSGETATPTVAIGQDIASSATPTFAGLNLNGNIIFEGATANEFETTLSVTDPTADRTITIPDATTTLVGTDTTQTLSNKTLTTPIINGPTITATGQTPVIHGIYLPEPHVIYFEGSTADDFETILTVVNPTADRTVSLPDASGTLAISGNIALGADTTGNYVSGVSSGTGISVSHTPSEGSTATVSLDATLDNLSNVTVPSPTASDVLQWNGTAWVNVAASTVGATTLDGLSDVTAPTPTSGDFLKWNGTAWVNDPINLGTDTVGNYMSDVTAGTGVTVTHTAGEGSSPTIAIGQAVSTSSSVTFASVTAPLTGNASTATTLQTARNIAGQSFDGSANISIAPTDLTGVTSTATEINILDGATLSTTELNYVDGVTSAIQTQIDAKAPSASPTFTGTVTLAADPSSALQAATKQYVDNVAAGINFHEAVHAASVVNSGVIYNNGTAGVGATLTADTNRAFTLIDGETLTVGQRVLMKNQTDAKQNGIYTLTTIGSASAPFVLTRATDADNNPSGEMKTGDFCFVLNGTVNGGYGFINNSPTNPIVIGTDNITYTEFNAAQTLTNGSGINLVSNVLSVDTTTIQARVADVSDTEIGYLNGVTSAIQTQIDAKAPSANASFTGTFSAPTGTITSTMIADGTIVNADINASAAIDKTKISGTAITAGDTGTVTSTMIADGTIVNGDINASAGIALSKLATSTAGNIIVYNASGVPTAVAETGDVTISDTGVTAIATGVIVNADVNASAAIDYSKLASLTSGNILVGNASNVATSVAMSGDITITNTGATAIGSGVIVNADVNASAAIAHSKLANATDGQLLLGTTTTGVVTATTVTGDVTITGAGVTAISSGVIVNADVNTSAAIALSKLASGTSAQVVIANASGVPTYTTLTGDVTISNTGVTSIAANSVALGTDTTGNYMSGVSAGTGISVTHTPAEGSSATIALNATLDDLSNVSAATPVGGYVLTYDAIGSNWVPAGIQPPANLDNIGDVKAPSPTDGDLLKFFSATSEWKNATLTLDELSNVTAPSPATNSVLSYNGTAWVPTAASGGGATISTTAPASPTAGQIWFDSDTAKTYVYYDSYWVEVGNVGGTASVYVGSAAPASPTPGMLWFDSDSARTFAYYDSQWIEIGATATAAIVSDTAPSSPISGLIWFKSSTGQTFTYYDSFWIELGAQGVAAVVSEVAPTSPVIGQIWFNSSTGGSYVYYDTVWIEIGAQPLDTIISTIDAKGDILVGIGDNSISKVAVGTNDFVLTANSSTATGLQWVSRATVANDFEIASIMGVY